MPDESLQITSLARVAESTPTILSPAPSGPDPRYPAGMQLDIEQPEMAKLGIPETVAVGKRCYFQGYGKVAAVGQGPEGLMVTLQVTDMGIRPEDMAEGAAAALYPNGQP